MALKNLFKLEKLKIKAYKDRGRGSADFVGRFEAMFNPESFKERYEILYSAAQETNSSVKSQEYSRSKPSDLRLNLILDGTGVNDMGLAGLGNTRSVPAQVKDFLDLTFRMNGAIHEPNFLVVEWGELAFPCRLGSVDINYTNFDRDGTALRATLDLKLVADFSREAQLKRERKSSPDLTHSRIVKAGDTLPLLAREIYGSSRYYLWVARHNGLDNFRDLTPGQQIMFPPLPQDSGDR